MGGACHLTNNVSDSLWTYNSIITIKTCYTIIIHKRIYVWFHLNNLCLKLRTLVIFHILQRLTFFLWITGFMWAFLFTTVISQRSIRYYACTSPCNWCKKRCHVIKKQVLTVNLRWWEDTVYLCCSGYSNRQHPNYGHQSVVLLVYIYSPSLGQAHPKNTDSKSQSSLVPSIISFYWRSALYHPRGRSPKITP